MKLNERENAVANFIKYGYTNDAIASELGISLRTLRRIKHEIKNKGYAVSIPDNVSESESVTSLDKMKADYWQKKYKDNLKVTTLEQEILNVFKESIESYEPIERLNRSQTKSKNTPEELVLLLSDFHAGEEVNSEEVLGLNEYNIDIMVKRLERVYLATSSIIDKMSGYRFAKLNIFGLGDMVSGIIHEELLQGTCAVDQIVITADVLSEMIMKLSRIVPEIEFTGIVGNHGRFNKVPNFKKKYNNFDYLLYKLVESRCQNLSNVYFNIPKSGFALKQIFNFNFLLTHGDQINSVMGIPFYGIRRMDSQISQTLTAGLDKYPHYICMGHYHTNNILEKIGGKIIMNGSLKGGDEYSLGRMFTGGTPTQTLFSVHPKRGLTWTMNLNCE